MCVLVNAYMQMSLWTFNLTVFGNYFTIYDLLGAHDRPLQQGKTDGQINEIWKGNWFEQQ